LRVPTYKAKGALTKESGAQQLRVSASGQALAAPFGATRQMGQTTQQISASFIEQERENKRAQIIDSTLSSSIQTLQDATTEAMSKGGSDDMLAYFDEQTSALQQAAFEGMDKTTAARLAPKLNTQIAAARLNITKVGRTRDLETQKGERLAAIDALVNLMASGNRLQQVSARDELFGTTDELGNQISKGLIRDGLDSGIFTGDEYADALSSAKVRIPETTVRNEFAAAEQAGDPERVADTLSRLRDTKEFSDLDTETRTELIEQGVDLERQLIDREGRLAEKRKNQREDQLRLDQTNNYSDLVTRLEDADPNNQPTLLEVNKLLGSGGLTVKQSTAVRDMINDLDASMRDPAQITSMYSRIAAASTPAEIEEILGELPARMGTMGSIPTSDGIAIIKFGQGAKANTPLMKKIAKYEGFLKRVTGVDSAFATNFNDEQRQRQTDALETYYRLTTDPTSPVPPEEAYEDVKDQYLRQLDNQTPFIGFMAEHTKNVPMLNGLPKKLNQYDENDLAIVAEAIRTNTRLTQTQRALEFETIGLVRSMPKGVAANIIGAEVGQ